MNRRYFFILLFLTGLVALSAQLISREVKRAHFHSDKELEMLHIKSLNPLGPGEYFLTSEHCKGCHGKDSTSYANVMEDGTDVNLYDRWRATMMAQSARDPLWRAKVTQEILTNPAHSVGLQNKCTSCHSPAGKYNALFHGQANYGLQDVLTDSLGLDGITCSACHTIGSLGLGSQFSGNIPFDTTRHIYGPFQNPMAGPMQLYEGYTPTYGDHTEKSRICSSCHTLITETADLAGNSTGGEFVEQATYHEYLNSSYPAANKQCQTCHMPQLTDGIIIANANLALSPRYPFNQHYFMGANLFMLKLMKNNRTALNIHATEQNYDTAIAITEIMMHERSVDMDVILDSTTSDTAFVRVELKNKAGHKFPSGYPSRRAVLQLVVTDQNNDTIFKSGTFNPDYSVVGENPSFEPHHSVINQSNIPQIYEMVMGDVNYQYTTVLERAAHLLKDNRLPPDGFTSSHPSYDTVMVSADAMADPDFNKTSTGTEGTGKDFVSYHIPLNGFSGYLKISSSLHYQTLPPKFLTELFSWNDSTINSFHTMYDGADKTPVLVAKDSLTQIQIVGLGESFKNQTGLKVWPLYAESHIVNIDAGIESPLMNVKLFSSDGKLILNSNVAGSNKTISLPPQAGVYLLYIKTSKKEYFKKIINP